MNPKIRLSPAADDIYMVTSAFALALGVLSWDQYLLRLRFIRENTDSDSLQANAASSILDLEDADDEEEWLLGEPRQSECDADPSDSGVFVPMDGDPGLLHFRAAGTTGLSEWFFRQAEPDFFPSIPHGHSFTEKRRKLDAYRGWIYRGDKQIDREPRWKIIALWNDETFRAFASTAIGYYQSAFPRYRWPVLYPGRLPRRR